MSFWVVIPARYESTRLPGKLLLDLAGKPILQHVYERSVSSGAERVIIATDDERIVDLAKSIAADVVLTATSHKSGTERIAEVISVLKVEDDRLIVNVQGDEPLIAPENIRQVAELLKFDEQASIATLMARITTSDDLFNPNIVKTVYDHHGYSLYFSRASIPWNRDQFSRSISNLQSIDFEGIDADYYRHIGIYAYRAGFINTYVSLQPSPLEIVESLEQLRALHYGYKIRVQLANSSHGLGVDTEEDYQRVKALVENGN